MFDELEDEEERRYMYHTRLSYLLLEVLFVAFDARRRSAIMYFGCQIEGYQSVSDDVARLQTTTTTTTGEKNVRIETREKKQTARQTSSIYIVLPLSCSSEQHAAGVAMNLSSLSICVFRFEPLMLLLLLQLLIEDGAGRKDAAAARRRRRIRRRGCESSSSSFRCGYDDEERKKRQEVDERV